jgi:hypothetical protein
MRRVLLILLLPVLLPLGIVGFTLYFLHRWALYVLIWLLWLPGGKDVLIVYSDSPIWHDYMEREVLPSVQERAFVLNWSARNTWPRWSLVTHVFRSFGGRRQFNPMVIVFRPLRAAKVFRFWGPFNDWKRGYTEPVGRMRDELRLSL